VNFVGLCYTTRCKLSVQTTQCSGLSTIRNMLGTRYFLLLQNVQTVSVVHPASYSVGIRVLSWARGGGG